MLNKKTVTVFGKKHYLLGVDSEGIRHWLEKPSWDYDWYWGFGYIHTFTNNSNPARSKDINCHYHFNSFEEKHNMFDGFKETFVESVLTDEELWKLCELMKFSYIARDYSDALHIGGAHYTTNPCKDIIICQNEYDRINKKVLPATFKEVEKLLTPKRSSENGN